MELTGYAGGFPLALPPTGVGPPLPSAHEAGKMGIHFLLNILYRKSITIVCCDIPIMPQKLEYKRIQMKMVWIETLVPDDQFARKLDTGLDFAINALFQDLYPSDKGQPSVEPVSFSYKKGVD